MGILHLGPETHLSRCRRNVFAFATLFLLILMTYSNTFNASWHFDDETNILTRERLHLSELSWGKIKQTFYLPSHPKPKLYRPAACLSLALNYFFGQEDVFGYHLVNVSIHFLASIFLFLFVFQALNLPRLRDKYGQHAYSLALLATVFWAINPIQTQAVTYIVQRMASMAGMFYIMSMYFYVKGRTARRAFPMTIHYLSCGATAILAFSSKENAALLPISIFLLDLFLIQGLERKNLLKSLYLLSALLFVFLVIALVLRGPSIFSLNQLIASYGGREFTLLERLLTQPRVILHYLSLIFYPMPDRLSISHDISISRGLFEPPTTSLAILVIAFVLVISIAKSKRWPLPVYCVLFFFLNHLIESSIFPLELVFEHRNYIPSMLLFVPVSILMLEGLRFFSYKKSMMAILCAFLVLILVALGHSTFMRNFSWKTQESIWLSAIDRSPNLPRPYHNLARYYGSLGDREKEIAYYTKALELGIESHGETRQLTHYNLGLAYNNLGDEDKALEHLRLALEIDPQFSDAYNNMAAILIRSKQYDSAFDHLIRALTYNTMNYSAHHNLGIVLLKKGRIDEAVSEFKKALAIKESLITLLGLGTSYKYKKEFPKARYYLRKALDKNAKNVITRLHLIETLHLMQDEDSLNALLEETLDTIPVEKMIAIVEDIAADNLPDQESPDLRVALPLLERAYLQRANRLSGYAQSFQRLMELQ